ncbi:hypothetical protein B0H34DRAFT_653240 [Crassisporium funariophilum]|nr:hypothetical protein B0H34DRAFT_653240 [Crassisporium funariophilum]
MRRLYLALPIFLRLLPVSCVSSNVSHAPSPKTSHSDPAPTPTASQSPTTFFHVTSGNNENYFFRDNTTSAQLLLTSPPPSNGSTNATSTSVPQRLVVALPAGNNGALVYFLPLPSGKGVTAPLSVELVNGTMKSTVADFGNKGIQADLRFSADATLGVTIVGAVRALRDYVEGAGTMHEIFNYTLLSHSSTEVRLHRQYINSTSTSSVPTQNSKHPQKPLPEIFKSVDLYISIPPGSSARLTVTPSNNGTFTPPKIDIVFPSHGATPTPDIGAHVRVKVLTNETSLVGFDSAKLFLTPEEASTDVVKGVLDALPGDVVNQVSFLTFQDKFTAGGWRFLTYFGRDSLIALRMLMPLLTPDAIEAALGAVIERANVTGALCHEETIGDYVSFVMFYFYVDLLLLPALSHYFLDLPQGQNRSAQFLSKPATLQNGTYGDIIDRSVPIASYNIQRALPFFLSATPSPSELLAFRPGQPVGNWRDSNEGTGYGPIPFDVNVALVPANLRALEALVSEGILSSSDLAKGIEGLGEGTLDLGTMASKWETEASGLFEVVVPGDVAEKRLEAFVQEVGLDASVLNSSVNGTGTPASGNVSFYALSLMQDGTPVEVLNSDLGFNLMYGTNVSAGFLGRVVDALTPYPRGLLTNIGMVVANPAYDSNSTNVKLLDRTAYHGTVVWSFQQALMAGGLARQLGFCTNATSVDINPQPSPEPAWCDDTDLVQQLQAAQTRLWKSIKGASENIYSEVWSYSFDNQTSMFSVADLAGLSPGGTESDAIQLWSYGFLGLIEPDS